MRGRKSLADIAVGGGEIREIATKVTGRARKVIRADGRLVTESFVNPHLHLDKVYTLEMQDSGALEAYHGGTMGAAMTAIERASRVKERYDESWILANVRRALRLALHYGCG